MSDVYTSSTSRASRRESTTVSASSASRSGRPSVTTPSRVGSVVIHASPVITPACDVSTLAGYEAVFEYEAEGLDNRYSCPVCLAVLRQPVQTKCGHRFCNSCFRGSIAYVNTCSFLYLRTKLQFETSQLKWGVHECDLNYFFAKFCLPHKELELSKGLTFFFFSTTRKNRKHNSSYKKNIMKQPTFVLREACFCYFIENESSSEVRMVLLFFMLGLSFT